jgi:hypothetical protein
MNINAAFPSKYLKESDLNGAQPIVTIDRVVMENIGQGSNQENKPIVYFQGKSKGLVLNKTNGTMISRIAGTPDTDRWKGIKVRLVSAEVEFQGQPVSAIRVREVLKGGPAAAPPPPPPPQSTSEFDEELKEEDIPF